MFILKKDRVVFLFYKSTKVGKSNYKWKKYEILKLSPFIDRLIVIQYIKKRKKEKEKAN